MPRLIHEQDVKKMALGAALLAAGGGGDPYLGKLMAIKAIRDHGPVTLLDPAEVPDDACIIATGMMGAITMMNEKIPNGDEAVNAVRLVEKELGKKAYAIMPYECGGINSSLPLVVSAKTGLPIVDADGMGRAFPEMQMVTFHIYGASGSPMALHDERGEHCVVKTGDNYMLERVSRAVTVHMGGCSHMAEYGMTGAEMKRMAIPNTLTLCMELGRALRRAYDEKSDPIEAIGAATQQFQYGAPTVLFRGVITDVYRRSTDGFVRGKAIVEGFEENQKQTLEVDFQNENLVARLDGRIVATVPDIITFLDIETGTPITTEYLKYGYRVLCLGIPVSPMMRTPEALEVWGPRYFGYGCDFIPLETIHRQGDSKCTA